MNCAVIGTGYVGLVHGTCLAERGHVVICTDRDRERIAALEGGDIPIHEPGLAELVARNVEAKRLRFSRSVSEAIEQAQVIFLAVGTPMTPTGGADLSQLETAADQVGRALTRFATIVVKSTVPVGTVSALRARIESVSRVPFAIAFNPEFLREGRAVADCLRPDRVVVGTSDPRARGALEALYTPHVPEPHQLQFMDVESAELCKYAANAMLATRVALINELAELAETVGADIDDVTRAMGADHRIGPHFLAAGPGFGGSCLPKDLHALLATGKDRAVPMDVVAATVRSNDRQKHRVAERVIASLGGVTGRRVCLWGLAFKAGTDDVRDSTSLVVARELRRLGADVVAADPIAASSARGALAPEIDVTSSHLAAADGADAIVVMTEWPQFAATNFEKLARRVSGRLIIDTRRVIPAAAARGCGFQLIRLGVGISLGQRPQAAVA